jgi:hypothetical protein
MNAIPTSEKGYFHFPSPEELAGHADALRDSLEIAEQCNFEIRLGGLSSKVAAVAFGGHSS